ncbi:hypothetical protein LINPERPRIM_LOCUS6097 [Linum perenne]
MKVPDSSNSNPRNNNGAQGISSFSTAAADRHHNRSSRSPPSKFSVASRNSDARLHQFKKPNPRTGGGADEGIEATAPTASIGASPATGKGLRIEERKDSSYSPMRFDSGKLTPRLRGEKEEKPRAKFSASLSRKEIEDDFMAMFGHRPARRPKKRPRIVQKQLDSLFPGLWLGEVTAEWYKVPENPDTGKK